MNRPNTPAHQRVVDALAGCSAKAGVLAQFRLGDLNARGVEPVKVQRHEKGGVEVWHIEAGFLIVYICTNAGGVIESLLPLEALSGSLS